MTTDAFIPTVSVADRAKLEHSEALVASAVSHGWFPPRHTVEITGMRELDTNVMCMTIRDPYIAQHGRPAQFVDFFTHDPMRLMPRPFGIGEINGDEVSFIFAVVGEGTRQFAAMHAGDVIDVLGPLGRPFKTKEDANYVLVAGGLGVPPVIAAAQHIAGLEGSRSTAVFGYRKNHFADDIVARYADTVHSIDESEGNVITVLDRIEDELKASDLPPVILSCGPMPMMKAIATWAAKRDIPCQFSLEQRMGCGYGTCVLCTTDTVDGRLKVCADGPVFTREQLGWE
ncbi:dihydroorotate dehydrogenase electron transfer subunit [Bifidobacterium callimiconis]|uniref:dihydroorotate dehydrogenase electron transfer subunit n=1 Tax=Bifidobacterium callimiconis TaxID=2306973 RepID=UPI001BDC0FB5|nr:dihydroorotate dehydrogenase electron transfer subunit [Bifidobacterium callimiconis]MBT1176444.1 dihydroorotate dehydrogenase electron transfer subunit [Bifidobacterium callimiconis]